MATCLQLGCDKVVVGYFLTTTIPQPSYNLTTILVQGCYKVATVSNPGFLQLCYNLSTTCNYNLVPRLTT